MGTVISLVNGSAVDSLNTETFTGNGRCAVTENDCINMNRSVSGILDEFVIGLLITSNQISLIKKRSA